MLLVTFFSVSELPEKNRKGGCNNPPLVRRGLKQATEKSIQRLRSGKDSNKIKNPAQKIEFPNLFQSNVY